MIASLVKSGKSQQVLPGGYALVQVRVFANRWGPQLLNRSLRDRESGQGSGESEGRADAGYPQHGPLELEEQHGGGVPTAMTTGEGATSYRKLLVVSWRFVRPGDQVCRPRWDTTTSNVGSVAISSPQSHGSLEY